MRLGESKEDYIESIYRIGEAGKESVRVIDIARDMDVAKSSASLAVKGLEKMEYVERGPEYEVYLTEEGLSLGRILYERYRFWKTLLLELGVGADLAETEARKIEHSLSEESFQKLKHYLQRISNCQIEERG